MVLPQCTPPLEHDSRVHEKNFHTLLHNFLVQISPIMLIFPLVNNLLGNARIIQNIIDHGQSPHGTFPHSNLLISFSVEIILFFEILILFFQLQ